jgi:CRISPR-associated protein Cas5t
METIWLRVRAPFAAFRGFQAGVYRATSPTMPPSTAYGLILNLAGVEMRGPMNGITTEIRSDLPRLGIAVGMLAPAERCSLYQQLHSYPVNKLLPQAKVLSPRTHGAKFWITPVRREILVGFDAVIGARADDGELFELARKGLRGELETPRYGLPFAGDNNLLIDRIDVINEPPTETYWYTRVQPGDPPRKGSCRLTVGINRTDNSRTTSFLYAPTTEGRSQPPETAWTWTPAEA